jgi:hypothetical protein
VPSAISVNMLSWRVASEATPRWKKGSPPHSTTGVASRSWPQASSRGASTPWSGRPGSISNMAATNTGSVSSRLTRKRRCMSRSSGLSSSSSAETRIASRAMPQLGQLPASSRSTSGCIGQV